MANEKSAETGGLGAYSPELYADLDLNDYRSRFPVETSALTDEQLFRIVSNQDDDRNDDEWRTLFGMSIDERTARRSAGDNV